VLGSENFAGSFVVFSLHHMQKKYVIIIV